MFKFYTAVKATTMQPDSSETNYEGWVSRGQGAGSKGRAGEGYITSVNLAGNLSTPLGRYET